MHGSLPAKSMPLLMIDQLARHIGPGLLTEHLQPLIACITWRWSAANDAPRRHPFSVHIMAWPANANPPPVSKRLFEPPSSASGLQIGYFTRSRNLHSERRISPQRLIHYRENW